MPSTANHHGQHKMSAINFLVNTFKFLLNKLSYQKKIEFIPQATTYNSCSSIDVDKTLKNVTPLVSTIIAIYQVIVSPCHKGTKPGLFNSIAKI